MSLWLLCETFKTRPVLQNFAGTFACRYTCSTQAGRSFLFLSFPSHENTLANIPLKFLSEFCSPQCSGTFLWPHDKGACFGKPLSKCLTKWKPDIPFSQNLRYVSVLWNSQHGQEIASFPFLPTLATRQPSLLLQAARYRMICKPCGSAKLSASPQLGSGRASPTNRQPQGGSLFMWSYKPTAKSITWSDARRLQRIYRNKHKPGNMKLAS